MKKIIVIQLLLLLLTGCAVYDYYKSRYGTRTHETVTNEAKKGRYNLITPEDIKREYLNNPASLFLVDTRQEWEYESQHIQGAVNLPVKPYWWYPYYPKNRKDLRNILGPDKNRRVIFY
jgi:predicted sulfurtransferase